MHCADGGFLIGVKHGRAETAYGVKPWRKCTMFVELQARPFAYLSMESTLLEAPKTARHSATGADV
jgi:hypothetical protein